MSPYQRFELENGKYILLEVEHKVEGIEGDAQEENSMFPTIREMTAKVSRTFDDAIESAKSSADLLIRKFASLSEGPDEIEITFGLKATGDVGNLMISKAGAEANYTVTLKWIREKEKSEKRKANSNIK